LKFYQDFIEPPFGQSLATNGVLVRCMHPVKPSHHWDAESRRIERVFSRCLSVSVVQILCSLWLIGTGYHEPLLPQTFVPAPALASRPHGLSAQSLMDDVREVQVSFVVNQKTVS